MNFANLDRRRFLTAIPAGGAAAITALWKVQKSSTSCSLSTVTFFSNLQSQENSYDILDIVHR